MHIYPNCIMDSKAVKKYRIIENPKRSWKPYVPGWAKDEGVIYYDIPRKGDCIDLYADGSIEIYRPSDVDAFRETAFLDMPSIEELISNGIICEIAL